MGFGRILGLFGLEGFCSRDVRHGAYQQFGVWIFRCWVLELSWFRAWGLEVLWHFPEKECPSDTSAFLDWFAYLGFGATLGAPQAPSPFLT